MILDSNFIIYSAIPENEALRDLIIRHSPVVSAISRIEVMGFGSLSEAERIYFDAFFKSAGRIAVSEEIIDEAIVLRQQRKMSLGDAIIAATAIVYKLPLATRNTKDFKWIDLLTLIDPFDS
jgi:toxin FitB